MTHHLRKYSSSLAYIVLGAVLGILIIHPVAMLASWQEVGEINDQTTISFWNFLEERLIWSLTHYRFPMTIIYALIGGIIGLCFGFLGRALHREAQTVRYFEDQLAQTIPDLIARGENARLEFKSSVRWDFQRAGVNRSLETAIARAIVSFFNHKGGILLIGVNDNGEIVGLENDYRTLHHKNRDGFQRCVTDIVKAKLGGDLCPLLHFTFQSIAGKDVCAVAIEAAPRPVYLDEGNAAKFFVRTGNSTRELNVRDALNHAAARWPRG